jgi:hypothetical protein
LQIVRTRRDGSYDVELQSGEVRKAVQPANVREAAGPACAPGSPDAISPPASPEEAASLAVSPSPARHAFSIGDTVEANCRGLGQYYMGVVTGILDDGSFRISYTDGDCESGVPERYIRRMQNRRRPSKAAQSGSTGSGRSPLKPLSNKVAPSPQPPARLQHGVAPDVAPQDLTVWMCLVLVWCAEEERRRGRLRQGAEEARGGGGHRSFGGDR